MFAETNWPETMTTIAAAIVALAGVYWDIRRRLSDNTALTKKVHTLVNSNFATQLRVNVLALERVAEITKSPADYAAHLAAKELYDDHMRKQAEIDNKKGTT